jgi:hypothetical protein
MGGVFLEGGNRFFLLGKVFWFGYFFFGVEIFCQVCECFLYESRFLKKI